MALGQSLDAIASFASPYRRCADQPMVSSAVFDAQPLASSSAAANTTERSKLARMRRAKRRDPGRDSGRDSGRGSGPRRKNYSATPSPDWEESFAAPMQAVVPPELGGLRLDQALARLFPQYSRNRLQAWLESGHIRIENPQGKEQGRTKSKTHVAGGERIRVEPPALPSAASPQAQRMPLKVVYEDAELIVID